MGFTSTGFSKASNEIMGLVYASSEVLEYSLPPFDHEFLFKDYNVRIVLMTLVEVLRGSEFILIDTLCSKYKTQCPQSCSICVKSLAWGRK